MEWERIVGGNIRAARKAKGLTQEQLALEAGVDLRYLGGIERGEHSVTVGVIGKLSSALTIHPAALFGDASEGGDQAADPSGE
jgi:transcriptional regulator with XRE-family HTH domain